MAILSKGCKPDKFDLQNSLKLSFRKIRGLHSNFVQCESFLESKPFALCETNLDGSTDSGNFSLKVYISLIQKDPSYVSSCSLCKSRTCFFKGLFSRKLWGFLLMFSTRFSTLSVLLLFPLFITFFIVMHSFLFYLSRILYRNFCFAYIINFCIVDDLAKRLFLHFS